MDGIPTITREVVVEVNDGPHVTHAKTTLQYGCLKHGTVIVIINASLTNMTATVSLADTGRKTRAYGPLPVSMETNPKHILKSIVKELDHTDAEKEVIIRDILLFIDEIRTTYVVKRIVELNNK